MKLIATIIHISQVEK